MPRPPNPIISFCYFKWSAEVIQLVALIYVRFLSSLRNVKDLLFKLVIDVCHETVRFWRNMFGPLFASDIRPHRVSRMCKFCHWCPHLDEVYVELSNETVYFWQAVDYEGEGLESHVSKARN